MAIKKEYNVEFNDSLLDLAGWKNARYEGSKLTGVEINKFTQGDVSYGQNPVIENKVVALYIGNTLIGGDGEEDAYTEITNHSYATVDKILIIDLTDDRVQIIDRQNYNPVAFRRHVDRDLFEGSSVHIKLLDFSVENALKPRHAVKFNRGSLQKVYAYTANANGFEDGVFGGFGVRPQLGEFIDNLSGSVATPFGGMFGYGSMFINSDSNGAVSASLFNTSSIDFVETLPSELNAYAGDVNTETLGLQLNLVTQSFDASAPLPNAATAVVGFDTGTATGTSNNTNQSGGK
jgi:hypothetical protein